MKFDITSLYIKQHLIEQNRLSQSNIACKKQKWLIIWSEICYNQCFFDFVNDELQKNIDTYEQELKWSLGLFFHKLSL